MEMRLIIKANEIIGSDTYSEWVDCSTYSLQEMLGLYDALKLINVLDCYEIEYRTKAN